MKPSKWEVLREQRRKDGRKAVVTLLTYLPEKWRITDTETGQTYSGDQLAAWHTSPSPSPMRPEERDLTWAFLHAMQGILLLTSSAPSARKPGVRLGSSPTFPPKSPAPPACT